MKYHVAVYAASAALAAAVVAITTGWRPDAIAVGAAAGVAAAVLSRALWGRRWTKRAGERSSGPADQRVAAIDRQRRGARAAGLVYVVVMALLGIELYIRDGAAPRPQAAILLLPGVLLLHSYISLGRERERLEREGERG